MRSTLLVLMVSAALTAGAAQGPAPATPAFQVEPTESGTVQGRVLLSDTTDPVAGATIRLVRKASTEQTKMFFDATAGRGRLPNAHLRLAHDGVTALLEELEAFPGSPLAAPIVTDNLGRFRIDHVPSGSYAVVAEKEGFFGRGTDPESPAIYDGAARGDMVYAPVTDKTPATVEMRLIPAAAISGRVTDSLGIPRVNQDVRALRMHREGNVTVLRGVSTTTTDDRGKYRLHTLPPGEYFVGAGLGSPEYSESEARCRDGQTECSQVKILQTEKTLFAFHPSATDPRTVSPIILRGGEDLDNRDIRVLHAPVIKISGQILNDSDLPNISSASVHLMPEAGSWIIDFGGVLGGTRISAGAGAISLGSNRWKFEISGAFATGSYELHATLRSERRGNSPMEAQGMTMIQIGSQNIQEAIIVVKSPSGEQPR